MASLDTVTTITADDTTELDHILAHFDFQQICRHGPSCPTCPALPPTFVSVTVDTDARTVTVTRSETVNTQQEWAVE